jgi:hypothetical protein
VAQLYNALTGLELKQLILKHLDEKLEATGKFNGYTTYPNVQFWANVQVHLPLMADRDFQVEEKVEYNILTDTDPAETISVVASLNEDVDNPADKIRDENNMPVFETRITKGHGGLVQAQDVPVVRGKQK